MTNTATNVTAAPFASRTIPVHKTDEEGVLFINALSGVVQQPIEDRPEWADGLSCALLAERHGWYASRLGSQYADEHKMPEVFNYADLGWIGVTEEGEAVEIAADDEFRMEVISEVIGADRDEGTITGEGRTEVELSLDRTRTGDEVAALEHAQEQGFEPILKDGTHN
ncbi:hypothetical protein [Methylobacterium ajmalii]|jgi:hypothetical protein|uniref:hypothetical protein n=1 Tax=Methylobacterium ajmalii TaxID=2738439 RepID=UPI00190CE1C6|nr:hypothetical protein [Methylobacterium ajmalii]MBK3400407.1 hypothetical protein [Methylobacterium ajmalii]MBK3407551.1 hypothetical protein [Methylobacterium ajmalii]MBK3422101.1 hypothetical protein [Methylobacterium ajmalii]MBZ6415629.1 hypothetical protein [Methylobacterium sp.]